jgi:hypothetical protein
MTELNAWTAAYLRTIEFYLTQRLVKDEKLMENVRISARYGHNPENPFELRLTFLGTKKNGRGTTATWTSPSNKRDYPTFYRRYNMVKHLGGLSLEVLESFAEFVAGHVHRLTQEEPNEP